MADDETTTEESKDEAEDVHGPSDGGEAEDNRPEDTLAESKTCPECGAPVDDVRATCIDCGYEYKDEDHEDTEAGNEFLSGSQVDDEGNEQTDEEPAEDTSPEEGESDDR